MSTIPFTFNFDVEATVVLSLETFPFNLLIVVLNGSGKFLSSNERTASFIVIGPIFNLAASSFFFATVSFVSDLDVFFSKITEIFGFNIVVVKTFNPLSLLEIPVTLTSIFFAIIFVLSFLFIIETFGL